MADKKYRLDFALSNGTTESVEFTVQQGERGADGVVDVTGAKVGQTIRVTAVDGNGKPTAWEAVDYQPRTHWVEAGGEVVHKLDNKFIDAEWMATTEKSIVIPDGSYQNGFGELILTGTNLEAELYKGNTYRVVFEGVSYECVAVDPESDDFAYDFGENALILGNARVLEEAYGHDAGAYGEDTGEPFCLAQYGENWDVYLGGEWTEKEAMVCFGVYRVTEVPIKLPEKFLPDSAMGGTSAPSDWNASEGEPGHVLNRTHWLEVADTEIAHNYYRSCFESSVGVFIVTAWYETDLEEVPKTMSIIYDDVEYKNLQATTLDGMGTLVGNLSFLNAMAGASFPNTGEPFIAMIDYLSCATFLTMDATETSHKIKISVPLPKGVPLDYRYLPDAVEESVDLVNATKIKKYLDKGVAVLSLGRRTIHANINRQNTQDVVQSVVVDDNGAITGKVVIYDKSGDITSSRMCVLDPNKLRLTSRGGKLFDIEVDDNGTLTVTEV